MKSGSEGFLIFLSGLEVWKVGRLESWMDVRLAV
jgi:hypothetical protein